MDDFKKWKDRYNKHWATKEQMQRLIELGVLTAEQYKEIINEDYVI